MRALIGIVKGIEGKFSARDADGNIVELSKGDKILEGMVVFGDKSNSSLAHIDIRMQNGDADLIITGENEQLFDSSLIDDGAFEHGLASESVEEVLDNTEESEDDLIDLGETAAGEGRATGGGAQEDEFAERDGAEVNVVSGLRNAPFGTNELAATTEEDPTEEPPTEEPPTEEPPTEEPPTEEPPTEEPPTEEPPTEEPPTEEPPTEEPPTEEPPTEEPPTEEPPTEEPPTEEPPTEEPPTEEPPTEEPPTEEPPTEEPPTEEPPTEEPPTEEPPTEEPPFDNPAPTLDMEIDDPDTPVTVEAFAWEGTGYDSWENTGSTQSAQAQVSYTDGLGYGVSNKNSDEGSQDSAFENNESLLFSFDSSDSVNVTINAKVTVSGVIDVNKKTTFDVEVRDSSGEVVAYEEVESDKDGNWELVVFGKESNYDVTAINQTLLSSETTVTDFDGNWIAYDENRTIVETGTFNESVNGNSFNIEDIEGSNISYIVFNEGNSTISSEDSNSGFYVEVNTIGGEELSSTYDYNISLDADLEGGSGDIQADLTDITLTNLPSGAVLMDSGGNEIPIVGNSATIEIDANGDANVTLSTSDELNANEIDAITSSISTTDGIMSVTDSQDDATTLTLSYDGEIDLSAVVAEHTSLEVVDLDNTTNESVNLSLDDVLDVSDTDSLEILGNTGDEIATLDTTGWSEDNPADTNFNDGKTYTDTNTGSDSVSLTVDEEIDIV